VRVMHESIEDRRQTWRPLSHLERAPYVYVRQSTLHQVMENTESTTRYYALRERAVALDDAPETSHYHTGRSHPPATRSTSSGVVMPSATSRKPSSRSVGVPSPVIIWRSTEASRPSTTAWRNSSDMTSSS
jgi:hypothetical protein